MLVISGLASVQMPVVAGPPTGYTVWLPALIRSTTNEPSVLLTADFETGLPTGWRAVGAPGWDFNNPGGRTNQTGGAGAFAIADSDNAGLVAMNTALETPVLDFTGKPGVRLKFKTFFSAYMTSTADVDVSLNGGTTWRNVWRKTAADFQGTPTLDLSLLVGNQANVKLRFHYYYANWANYWQIDAVQVETLAALTPPSDLKTTVADYDVSLQWADSNTTEAGFKVERAPVGSTSWAVIARPAANAVSYVDANLPCGTPYQYRVRAINANLTSSNSNIATATTGACVGGASLNEAFASDLPTDWSVTKNQGALGWVFNDPGARGNQTGGSDTFAIADSDKEGAWLDTELRTPTLNFAGQNAVQLTFKTALVIYQTNTTVAEVDISKNGGTTWVNVWRQKVDFKGPVTLDISAQAANQSNVKVRFHYKANWEYYWQIDDVQLTGLTAPAAPTMLAAALAANGAVNLAWRTTGATGFTVERAPSDCTTWAQLATLTDAATSYTDASVASTTDYCYRVSAFNAAGASPPSTPVTATSGDRSMTGIDLTISLYAGAPVNTAAERAKYEAILAYFADGVYEASNGVNKLHRVTMYTGGANFDTANVQWIPSCWPNAHISGYGRSGTRVEMCDVFQSNNFLADDTGAQGGGYTIAHEWGHYYYGMFDEYVGSQASTNPGSPQLGDTPPEYAIMNNQWSAVNGDPRWLNFSAAVNYQERTAQGRVFGASAWNTLARTPNSDPHTNAAAGRLYHPELASAKPNDGEWPVVDLLQGDARAAARSMLEIVWVPAPTGQVNAARVQASLMAVTNQVVRQIVIDRSAALSDTGKLADIKSAVATLIDAAPLGDTLGLIAYDGTATVVFPLTDILTTTTKATLKAAVAGLTGGTTATAPGDALQLALNGLTAASVPTATTRVVNLITAGANTTGSYPLNLVPAYAANYVMLDVIGYGATPGAEATMRQLVAQANGTYYPVADLNGLRDALKYASQATSLEQETTIKAGWATVAANSDVTIPFQVDASLATVTPSFAFYGTPQTVTLALADPQGGITSVDPTADCTTENEGPDLVSYCAISADVALTGTWQLQATAGAAEVVLSYWIDGTAKAAAQSYTVNLSVRGGAVIAYPQPIVVEATLSKLMPIAGAVITGTVEDSGAYVDYIQLHDDGVAPDRKADDGTYAGYVDYWSEGEYYLTVQLNNSAGTAVATDKGLMTTKDITDTLIGENFERYAELTVNVTGWQPDDHPDFSDDTAWPPTNVTLDNTPLPGRIDMANDVDVFSLTIPANYTGTLGLRVDKLGLGMDPWLFIYAADHSWELTRYLDYAVTSDAAIFVPLEVTADQQIFVEVWHYDETAATGTYDISAGPYLGSDPTVGGMTKTKR